ncbi:MAG: hypothetical protein CMJ18_27520 [Phycisphaeraceae bacterium]|nr:hypothetical protein [Phycisphaeraceae bacterium]
MSRTMFLLGLVLSVALHAYLLSIRPSQASALKAPPARPVRVDVVPVPAADVPVLDSVPETTTSKTAPQPASPPQASETSKPAPRAAQARLEPVAEPVRTESPDRGDFAGTSDGTRRPRLRIDWGSPAHARAVLEAGRMKLVVLDSAPGGAIVSAQVRKVGHEYRTLPLPGHADLAYSNRLRVLRNVPAFAGIGRALALRPGRDLAVAMPIAVQKMLDHAKRTAPIAQGLRSDDILDFRGRFRLAQGRLTFEITHVERRTP